MLHAIEQYVNRTNVQNAAACEMCSKNKSRGKQSIHLDCCLVRNGHHCLGCVLVDGDGVSFPGKGRDAAEVDAFWFIDVE